MIPTKTYKLFTTGITLCLLLLISQFSFSQSNIDSLFDKLDPQKFAASVAEKAKSLDDKLTAKSVKVLSAMQSQEEKIYKKLFATKDSVAAKLKLSAIKDKYASVKDNLNNKAIISKAKQYLPDLDSLSTSLKFLEANGVGGKVKDALSKAGNLQDKFQKADEIKNFIKERKQELKEQLEKLGMVKQLKKINKQVYYYAQQINEYKAILNDPKKIEKKALELLSKTKFFKDFMRKNSMLASLFRIPGDDDVMDASLLAGLQTRSQVTNLIQQQIASGGPNAQQQFQQNMQAAQSQLNELKNKLIQPGSIGNGDGEMPDFKPKTQKTKSFFQRLEYDPNIQTNKASNFFPNTSDIGLSVGYKLNEKSIIGIGASYKMGLGRGWNNLRLSHEGVGLRTYADIKLKGSFWLSGGYEQNYKSAFSDFDQLRERNAWQQSGLVGISKVISLKTKLFKKTNVKLLWDFLSYEQVPVTQPLLFRIGYNF